MFERYTEKARRLIHFAWFEASSEGAAQITPVHMLLGLLREDPELFTLFLPEGGTAETLRTELSAKYAEPRKQVSTSGDLPLSHPAKRILAYGADHCERLSHPHIDTVHLLLGLLQEPSDAATFLEHRGITLDRVLEHAKEARPNEAENGERARRSIAFAGRPETHTTIWTLLDGRELEVMETIESDLSGTSVTCSLKIRAYGQERSFDTRFDIL